MVTKTTKTAHQKEDVRLAKKAQQTLNNFGVNATYAQCLELLARLGGARTLHVKQAKALDENAHKMATRQASNLMFKTFGSCLKRNAVEVIGAVEEAFALESKGSRYVEAAMAELFFEGGVELCSPYDLLMPKDLPSAYQSLCKNLLESITQDANTTSHELNLFQGTVRDWSVSDDPEQEKDPLMLSTYALSIKKSDTAVFVTLHQAGANPIEQEDSLHAELGLIIEINDGLPCMHIATAEFGDVELSVFSTKEGIFMEPGNYDKRFQNRVSTPAKGFDSKPGEISLSKLLEMRSKYVPVTEFKVLKSTD